MLMIFIKILVFNPFQVNCYILYDDTKECIIIDPGCHTQEEYIILENFINQNNLKPVAFYNTHCHVDHIAGNYFVSKHLKIPLGIHKAGEIFLENAISHAQVYGFNIHEVIKPSIYLEDNDFIKFGNSELKILYTPGHADGSVCFYSEKEKFVIVGDVLFESGIGRTDFPTGDYDLLIDKIKNKLLVLDDSTVVYPGHGNSTTIGEEKKYNPFLK